MNEIYKHIGSPLTKAIEECAEFIHMACKVDRFGWFNYNPDDSQRIENIDLLKREMHDVVEAFDVLEKSMRRLKRP